MNNLVDIQSQIEKLQKQADQIRSKEFARTVQDIKKKMTAFGITIKDLQPAKSDKTARASKKSTLPGNAVQRLRKAISTAAGSKVAAKYRSADGQTWTGRGLTPRWLKALLAEGHNKDEFLVK